MSAFERTLIIQLYLSINFVRSYLFVLHHRLIADLSTSSSDDTISFLFVISISFSLSQFRMLISKNAVLLANKDGYNWSVAVVDSPLASAVHYGRD